MDYFMRAILISPGKTPITVYSSRLYPNKRIHLGRRSGIYLLTPQRRPITANARTERQYQLPRVDNVEDIEKYRRGGFHPIHLADTFKDGRYRILHKLGHGGFSTVWLARDNHHQRLVSLKVLTAEASRQCTELKMLRHLDECARENPWRGNIIASLDDFTFEGPNGTHLCYVSQPGGPSISTMSDSPGEIAGTRRLRADLARKLSRQLAKAVSLMHDADVVHGGMLITRDSWDMLSTRTDITPKNVLLQLRGVDSWPTEVVYQQFGHPRTDQVYKYSGGKPDASAPEYLVEPATFSRLDSEYISEQALLIDLGEAFLALAPSPPINGVGTPVSYRSPELMLEMKAGKASDIWALACVIFEMRSGFPLFESFVRSRGEVLQEMVRILGIPPEPSHAVWEQGGFIFTGDERRRDSIRDRIREIGMYDEESSMYNGEDPSLNPQAPLLEPLGMSITEQESDDLADLLRRALDYSPENRLSAEKIANHRWLLDS